MTDETEFLDDFLLEAREIMDKLDLDFVQLEKSPDDEKLLGNIFRGMHTLKGSSGFFGPRQKNGHRVPLKVSMQPERNFHETQFQSTVQRASYSACA